MGMPPMGMPPMGTPWGGMGMPAPNQMLFPPGPRSMYGGGGAMSEYGGTPSEAGGNWSSSRSVYGESFGPSHSRPSRPSAPSRQSGYFPPMPPMPDAKKGNAGASPSRDGMRTRDRTVSGPATPGRVRDGGSPAKGAAPPPSSWKRK
jgi:serine/arginine repetitive matrix protein 2